MNFNLGFRVYGFDFWFSGLGFMDFILGFRVYGFHFWGLGFRVYDFKNHDLFLSNLVFTYEKISSSFFIFGFRVYDFKILFFSF